MCLQCVLLEGNKPWQDIDWPSYKIAADAANPIARPSKLYEVLHEDKQVGSSKDLIRDTSVRTESSVINISREGLRSVIQIEVASAAETTQQEESRSMSRNLDEVNIFDIFTSVHCATTDGDKDSFFSFVESVVKKTIYREVVSETLSRGFNCWTELKCFTPTLIKKSVDDLGSTANVAAFVMQRVVNAVKHDLSREPLATKKSDLYLADPGQLPPAPLCMRISKAGAHAADNMIKKSEDTVRAWWSCAKSARSINVHWSRPQTDGRLKPPTSKSFVSSSHCRSRSSDTDTRKSHTRNEEGSL